MKKKSNVSAAVLSLVFLTGTSKGTVKTHGPTGNVAYILPRLHVPFMYVGVPIYRKCLVNNDLGPFLKQEKKNASHLLCTIPPHKPDLRFRLLTTTDLD